MAEPGGLSRRDAGHTDKEAEPEQEEPGQQDREIITQRWTDSQALGPLLRLIRGSKGMSQAQLAAALTLVWQRTPGHTRRFSERWVRRVEASARPRPWLTRAVVESLAGALGCDPLECAALLLASGHYRMADILMAALGLEPPDAGQYYRTVLERCGLMPVQREAGQETRQRRDNTLSRAERQQAVEEIKAELHTLLMVWCLKVYRASRARLRTDW
jgi:transcriptional regulator with XRE-family HTH domain